jgi:hypothetical protein
MSKQLEELFKRHYTGYRYMTQKYPKAAKKRRIIKKWKKRFGPDMFEYILSKPAGLFSKVLNDPWFGGNYYEPT